jgi:hypothetical protein
MLGVDADHPESARPCLYGHVTGAIVINAERSLAWTKTLPKERGALKEATC